MQLAEERYNEKGELLEGQPPIEDDMDYYWGVFWELSSSRPAGMGVTGIPYSELVAYSQRQGYDEEEEDDFFLFIPLMDRAYKNAASGVVEDRRKKAAK